jgi:serpin B
VANRLWGQKGYNLNPAFLALTKENYGAGLEELDFLNQTEPSRLTINGWVEKQTQEKIKDLIPPGLLQKDTRLILTNAIYFKGNWSLQFSKAKTQELPFKRGQGEAVNCSLMSSRSRYGYMENESVQGLRMPYAGGELAMIILLPKTADGLPTLERQLTPANLAGWVGKLVDDEVFVWIPRFKLTSAFQLSGALQALGMRDAFAYGKADFSAIEPKKELFIGEVLHKAFVDVNEEGTEAAAATAVVMRAGAPPHAMPPPKIFRADHPFIFMIRHEKTGAMLFMGRLSDPSA